MNDAETIENFFGVYLLYCQNPKFKGRIYIGYTVDPNRRIQQHNKGKEYGGAWKTSNKGPWSMVLIIHGFPNDISALRFEWAWQHPHISRRLKHVQQKKKRESSFDFHFRILSEMLLTTPWSRLPLIVRWLNHNFIKEFPLEKRPPHHMQITSGQVISKKTENPNHSNCNTSYSTCDLCTNLIMEKKLHCLNIFCDLVCHLKCLAGTFLECGEYVPIEGKCPKCHNIFLWGDIVNKYKGYNSKDITINLDDDVEEI